MRFCIRNLHASRRHARSRNDRAFTLVEILVAMVVTLIMLGIVVTIFGMIGESVSFSRSTMEMTDRLRATKQRLQLDLAGITVPMLPPQSPDSGLGYFEYIEGPVGPLPAFTLNVAAENGTPGRDTTVGDNDDIIMFTTQSPGEPFVGRHYQLVGGVWQSVTLQSQVAEVVWFIRGTTLYRRQLLVKPELNRTDGGRPGMPTAVQQYATGQSFYANSDVSAHADGKGTAGDANLGPLSAASDPLRLVANSLGDLTKRENRYAHVPLMGTPANAPLYGWPFDSRKFGWFPLGGSTTQATTARLGLPTLQECSSPSWPLPIGTATNLRSFPFPIAQLSNRSAAATEDFDAWENPNPWGQVDALTGVYGVYSDGTRQGEDVILTNVLSFDVKVWDPSAPIFAHTSGTLSEPGDPGPGYGVPPATPGGFPAGYAAAMVGFSTGTPAGYSIAAKGAYVDLNYASFVPAIVSSFSGPCDPRSGLNAINLNASFSVPASLVPAVYDTWSTHYERDGIDQGNYTPFVGADEGTNGIDDNNNGLIDEDAEQETAPPYASPIRGLQIKIRCFDPDSKQIREVTIVQEFLPE